MFKNTFIILLFACSSFAVASDDHNEAKRLLDSGDILPLETILKKISNNYPGKVLEVEFESEHGLRIYEIELLTDNGTVLELKVDAITGEHLSTKKEN